VEEAESCSARKRKLRTGKQKTRNQRSVQSRTAAEREKPETANNSLVLSKLVFTLTLSLFLLVAALVITDYRHQVLHCCFSDLTFPAADRGAAAGDGGGPRPPGRPQAAAHSGRARPAPVIHCRSQGTVNTRSRSDLRGSQRRCRGCWCRCGRWSPCWLTKLTKLSPTSAEPVNLITGTNRRGEKNPQLPKGKPGLQQLRAAIES